MSTQIWDGGHALRALVVLMSILGLGGLSAAQNSDPVTVRAVADRSLVAPGDKFKIAVVFDHEEGYHSWPNKEVGLGKDLEAFLDKYDLRTQVNVEPGADGLEVLGIQWPPASPGSVADPIGNAPIIKTLLFSGKAVAYLVLSVGKDAKPGDLRVPVTVKYQSCNEHSCLQPQNPTIPVDIKVTDAAAASASPRNEPDLFATFDESKVIPVAGPPRSSAPATNNTPAVTPPQPSQVVVAPRTIFGFTVGASLLLIALAAMLGGAILNLTPCVLPIIPIKVLSLVEHAGNPRRRLVLGLWMALGVVAFWFVIGLPMAFVSSLDPTRFLFGHWWVTLVLALLIALMGLGIMGLFSINLPQAVYMINPKADTARGSFFFGVMAGVLGLPCFGFVAGGLLAGAAALPTFTIIVIFTSIGIGMGAPYLILTAKPGLLTKIPRTGPASELVKQVLGLLILAAAGLFTSVAIRTLLIEKPYLSESLPYWVVTFFVAIAGLWLTLRVLTISKTAWPKVVMPLLALLLFFVAASYASVSTSADRRDYELRLAGKSAWQPFSEDGLRKALGEHKVVVVDFTASWCINCKFLKRTVLDREPLYTRLREGDVAILEADLTSSTDPGWDFLHSIGQTAVPTLAIYGPAIDKPIIYNAYTQDLVIRAIDTAKGGSAITQR